VTAADLPTTRREALLKLRGQVELLAADPRFGIPGVLELILVTANDYPAAEEHIDPVPHDPDLPRDLGAVERGACGAVLPPLGDICQMQPGHRDHMRTSTLAVEIQRLQGELQDAYLWCPDGVVERLRAEAKARRAGGAR
jgi:hypothetical protein